MPTVPSELVGLGKDHHTFPGAQLPKRLDGRLVDGGLQTLGVVSFMSNA